MTLYEALKLAGLGASDVAKSLDVSSRRARAMVGGAPISPKHREAVEALLGSEVTAALYRSAPIGPGSGRTSKDEAAPLKRAWRVAIRRKSAKLAELLRAEIDSIERERITNE